MVGNHFPKKTIRDVPIDGATVLLRADYNVPLTNDGAIADDFRMTSSLPTLRYLIDRGCKIIIIAHLGRPDGSVNKAESLEPVAAHLERLLSHPVQFVPECIGDQVKQAAKRLRPGAVLVCENLRFHAGEEANDTAFAEALARDTGAEYFVQDGFGVVHRAHASTASLTSFLPSVAGLLVEKEYSIITRVMEKPKRPMVAILGGAKISDKIGVIERFVNMSDRVLIGGAMANTFLKYHGHPIGKSLHEDGLESVIDKIYSALEKKDDDFMLLPRDVAVSESLEHPGRRTIVGVDDVTDNEYILDIGPDTIYQFSDALSDAATVVWNGTLGYAEAEQFSHGSARIALTLAQHPETTSVIGGGDTADFVLKWDSKDGQSFTHVSTGGGASLELMAGARMPGVDALLDASRTSGVH